MKNGRKRRLPGTARSSRRGGGEASGDFGQGVFRGRLRVSRRTGRKGHGQETAGYSGRQQEDPKQAVPICDFEGSV